MESQDRPREASSFVLNRKTATVISVSIFVVLYVWGLVAALTEISGRRGRS